METLKIAKTEYPFNDTAQLRKLIKDADVKLAQIGKAKNETKRFAFLACKAACEAKKTDFNFRWEEFISLVEPEVDKKAVKLLAEMKAADKIKAEAKGKKQSEKDDTEEKKAKEDTNSGKNSEGPEDNGKTDTGQK